MNSQSRGKGSGRLPHGPHGQTVEEVEADQRGRLVAAMVRSAAGRGYAGTTVSDLIEQAGVSRKTFYAYFDDRRDLLLDTFDTVAGELREQGRAAASPKAGATRQLETLMRRLCRVAQASPGAIALPAIEIAAVDPAGLQRRERFMSNYGELLEQCLQSSEDGARRPLPTSFAQAIAGASFRTIDARLRSDGRGSIADLAPQLARWVRSYDPLPGDLMFEEPPASAWSAVDGLVGGRAPGTLTLAPTGYRTPLSRQTGGLVHHVNRERILDAVARLVAKNGYVALTAQGIAERADVSERAFLAHFKSKDDAFACAVEVGHMKGMAIVARVREAATDWRTGVRDAVLALIEFFASEPYFARLALVDAPLAGPAMAKRTHEHLSGYARLLLEDAPQRRRPPAVAPEAAMHGLFELAFHFAVQGRVAELTSIGGEAVYMVLAPFLGVGAAAELAAGYSGRPPAASLS